MKLTITEEHLNRAIERYHSADCKAPKDCLVAQAAMDVFGARFCGCAEDHISLDLFSNFYIANELRGLMNDFDDGRYDKLRNKLPVTIDIGDTLTMAEYNALPR